MATALNNDEIIKKSINILLLGETGIGKSTLINAFANYSKFDTLIQSLSSKLISLIPTSFSFTDNKSEIHKINLGSDPNECPIVGASATQGCKAYIFKSEDKIVRLIDTPGIGDTNGLEQDRLNSQKILAFVSHYTSLHGIVILLRPNHSRLDTQFRFCVTELLCQLHQNASDNIVFLFTNARGTLYRAGDTLTVLKQLLAETKLRNPKFKIPLNENRMYFLDNDCFRFVAASKNGVQFTNDELKDYTKSWNKSRLESKRLIDYIANLKPHKVNEFLSINDARRMIIGFSRPLGDISRHIQLNLTIVEEQNLKIKMAGENQDQLKPLLHVPSAEMETIFYDKPITVCASIDCIKFDQSNGIENVLYVHECHTPCHLKYITPMMLDNVDLIKCSAMKSKKCLKCKCPYFTHMHIYYKNIERYKVGKELAENLKLQTKKQIIDQAKKTIDVLEKQREQLEGEQENITRASARFAHFLQKSAMASYNDALEDYLNHLIEGEKKKNEQGGSRTEVLNKMEIMKKAYMEEKKILESSISSNVYKDKPITPSEIYEMCQDLFKLAYSGPIIKKMVVDFEKVSRKEHETFTEITFDSLPILSGSKKTK